MSQKKQSFMAIGPELSHCCDSSGEALRAKSGDIRGSRCESLFDGSECESVGHGAYQSEVETLEAGSEIPRFILLQEPRCLDQEPQARVEEDSSILMLMDMKKQRFAPRRLASRSDLNQEAVTEMLGNQIASKEIGLIEPLLLKIAGEPQDETQGRMATRDFTEPRQRLCATEECLDDKYIEVDLQPLATAAAATDADAAAGASGGRPESAAPDSEKKTFQTRVGLGVNAISASVGVNPADFKIETNAQLPWAARKQALKVIGAQFGEPVTSEMLDSRTIKADWELAGIKKRVEQAALTLDFPWRRGAGAMGAKPWPWTGLIKAKPKSKAWRLGMGLAACSLALAFMAQAIYENRHQIASKNIWTRPILSQACKALGCSAGLAQAKDEMELEGSDVRIDESGRLVFTATLKNRASYESEAPKLWLGLEGEDGRTAASRVFEAKAWLGLDSVGAGSDVESKLAFEPMARKLTGFKASLVWGDK